MRWYVLDGLKNYSMWPAFVFFFLFRKCGKVFWFSVLNKCEDVISGQTDKFKWNQVDFINICIRLMEFSFQILVLCTAPMKN